MDRTFILLKDSNKVLKVSQGLPDWKAYVDFVNNIVVDGPSRVVHVSMEKLLSLVDAENIRKKSLPLLEIDIKLVESRLYFHPHWSTM